MLVIVFVPVGKARAYPSKAPLRHSTLGQAPGLTKKY